MLYNLARNIREFELERYLIIMFRGLMDIEKGDDSLRVIYTSALWQSLNHLDYRLVTSRK